jgi:pimeloyl-ACP methyl ester carboxylesterase
MTTLLCLHGWGGSKESFTELREALKNAPVKIYTPDLPGFGSTPEPPSAWTVDDYADWVEEWIEKNVETRDSRLFILGHSHGGRISMKLAVRGTLPIEHLYLCATAGIRRPRHFKRIVGLLLAKTGKFFLSIPGFKQLQPLGKKFLYKLVRVHDYEKASPVMRDTMIRVTQEDLRPLLAFIHTPTDIFWGSDDGMTPVADAYVIQKGIANSKLHVFQGVRHRVHRDKAGEIAAIIQENLQMIKS